MKEELIERCDFNDPASIVSAFIASMNRWEIESWRAMRAVSDSANPSSHQGGVNQSMNEIFAYYCTKKERKHGRLGSFQKPPEYDPSSEKIISSTIGADNKTAIVETERDAILGGGKYRYTLYRDANKWLLDNLKHEHEGAWERAIL